MSGIEAKLQKVKKRIRKIKLVSKSAMSHDKKERKKILEGLISQYQLIKSEPDSESIDKFDSALKNFLSMFEAQATSEENSQIRIEGLHQTLTSSEFELEEKKESIKPVSSSDKRKWEDYKEMEDVKKGKFTDEEIEQLKHSLCQYVKVLSSK